MPFLALDNLVLALPKSDTQVPLLALDIWKMGNSTSSLVLGPGLYRTQAGAGARALCPDRGAPLGVVRIPHYVPLVGGRLKWE